MRGSTSGSTLVDFTIREDYSVQSILDNLSLRPWGQGLYEKQSWGNWLHRISPYVGRMTPSFAHWLVRICSTKGETILDPFCGIGTIPLEANLQGRGSIGIDLNPYAYVIATAKMDRRPLEDHMNYLENLMLDTGKISLAGVPEYVREYYNDDTLKEIQALRSVLEEDKQHFLLGCLIGISQGHRVGHLSKPCAWTIPFKPREDDPGEYREVIPRLMKKVKRTYSSGFPTAPLGTIYKSDARQMPLEDNAVDTIISSPPYFDTVDYMNSNRLRLAVMGYYKEDQKSINETLIQDSSKYLSDMEVSIKEMRRVLKPDGKCILVLGDWHKNKKVVNTAEEVKEILNNIGFTTHGIIEDEIPMNKSVQRTTGRKQTIPGKDRMDRIVVCTNEK